MKAYEVDVRLDAKFSIILNADDPDQARDAVDNLIDRLYDRLHYECDLFDDDRHSEVGVCYEATASSGFAHVVDEETDIDASDFA